MRSARVADDDAVPVAPDQDRVVIHFDVDAFYAQVEEVREPRLRQVPMGVTQKYLIVTCNYPARERGLTKLMGTGDALKRCPELELVSGEDLTPYRQASKQIEGVLRRFGTAQRLGMDEIFLDATKTVHDRIRAGNHDLAWRGWLHRAATCVVQDNGYRPQDLRAQQPPSGAPLGAGAAAAGQPEELGGRWLCVATALQQWHLDGGPGSSGTPWPLLLVVGSAVAEEARRAVKEELGYRMSAGIACNKLLAKLCSGLHKPDDQTILPPPEAQAFVAPLPVRALPNVGGATEVKLAQLEIRTVKQLATLPLRRLLQHFSGRVGSFLFQAARGVDGSQVLESTAPKSITTEDSFRSCTSLAAAGSVLKVLVPDLVERVNEEWTSNGRVPRTLCMKWRYRGQGWQRKAATMQLPAAAHPSNGVPQQEKAVFSAAKALLTRSLEPRFNLTLISIGVTGFQSDAHRDADVQSFQRLLRRPPPAAVLQEGPGRKPADAAAADGGGGGGDSAMMRAEASLHLRRDYGSTASPGLMSKRAERRLREAAPAEAAQPRRKVPRPQEGGGGPLCSDSSPEPHRSPSTEGHSAEGPAGVLRAGTLERACSGTAKRPEGRPEQQEAEHSGGLPVVLAYDVGEEWVPEWLLHDSSDTHLRLAEQEPEWLPPSAYAAAAAGAPLHAGCRPQHQLQTAEGSARLRGSSPAHQQAGTGEEEARAERATGGDMQARRDCSEGNPATAPIAANPAPTPPHATAAGLSRPSVSSPAGDSPLPSPDASCRWGCASPLRGASASPVLEPSAAASAALHEELQAFFADTDDGGASGASGASMLMREGDPGSPSRSDAASDAELEAFLQSREH